MPADLSGRDLCASAFSVALRDQCSIDPSIAASDLPLNGLLIDGQPAELITQRSQSTQRNSPTHMALRVE